MRTVLRRFPRTSTITNMTANTVTRNTLITSRLGLPFICIHSGPGSRNVRGLVRNRLSPGTGIIIMRSLVSANNDSLGTMRTLHGGNGRVMNVITDCACNFPITRGTFTSTGIGLIALASCRRIMRRTLRANCVGRRSMRLLRR